MSEGDHWYTREGEPSHTIVGKNGKERNATVRDARKLHLVPSYTTISRIMSAPALERWKQNRLLLAAWDYADAAIDIEDKDEWMKTVLQASQQYSKEAAEEGKRIHGYIEAHYRGDIVPQQGLQYVAGVTNLILKECGEVEWIAEASFACREGHGGCADLHSSEPHRPILLDIKSKEFDEDNPPKAYKNHAMQLAAYRHGLGLPNARCGNVFVSRDNPGLASMWWWDEEEIAYAMEGFLLCKGLWEWDRNFSGSW